MITQDLKIKLSGIFEAEPSVGLVYLFGSQAIGKTGQLSDYDFAVYFNESDVVKRNNTLFGLAGNISKILNTDKIDAHSLNDIDLPELKYNIIAEGKIIFEREPFKVLVEPKILNEYFDFLYLLKKYNLTAQ